MTRVNVQGIGLVDFPDSMSQDDIAAAIEKHAPEYVQQSQLKKNRQNFDSENDAFGRAAKNLFTMDLAQPTEALADKAMGKNYDKSLSDIKARDDALAREHPVATVLGGATGLIGSLGSGVGEVELAGEGLAKGGAAVAKAIPKTWSQIGKSAVQQGVKNAPLAGAIGGLNAAARQPGDAEDKAIAGAEGAGIGVAGGFALPAAGEALSQKAIAPAVSKLKGALQGMSDSGKSVEVNKVLHNAVNSLGEKVAPEESSAGLKTAMSNIETTIDKETSQKWKQLGVTKETSVPTNAVKNDFNSYYEKLKSEDNEDYIPKNIKDKIDNWSDNEALGRIQSMRARVGGLLSSSVRAGDDNESRILRGLADLLKHHAENPELSGLTEDETLQYKGAREATKEKWKLTGNKHIQKVLGNQKSVLPESEVGNYYVNSGKERLDRWKAFTDLAKRASPEDKKNAYSSVRSTFVHKMTEAATKNAKVDANDNPVLNLRNLSKFIEDHKHIVDSDVFDKSQKATLDAISKLGRESLKETTPNSKMIDVALGAMSHPAVNIAAGAVTGGVLGGAHGAFEGAVTGGSGSFLANVLKMTPQKKINQLVMSAIRDDPEMAAALQATPQTITPKQQHKIMSFLGMIKNTGRAAVTSAVTSPVGAVQAHDALSDKHPLAGDAGNPLP